MSGHLQVERNYGSRDVSPGGISPLTPTSMFNSSPREYFGETWQSRRTGKNGEPVTMAVHYMRPSTQAPPRPTDNLSQGTRPGTRERRPDTAGQDEPAEPITSNVPTRGRSHRSPTQKTMLSKALAMANTAVLLDNAQNFQGAIEAYNEACDLLQQVLIRSSDLDDRKKLSAIRSTYSNRIAELHDLDNSFSGLLEKALPEDPPLDDTNHSFFSTEGTEPDTTGILESVQIPPRQESLLPEIFGGETYLDESPNRPRLHIPSLAIPMDTQYMPPPLSPRRPLSPDSDDDTSTPLGTARLGEGGNGAIHAREASTGSISWLDTFEDGDSSAKSSRLSSIDLGLRRNQSLVDEIEAEFDAALNAAVDAAYDDGVAVEDTTPRPDKHEQESFDITPPNYRSGLQGQSSQPSGSSLTREYDEDDSSEDEEKLLAEMTKGYVLDDFSFDNKSKAPIPRQSDSSTFSGQTWASSIPSTTATNTTTLSTLAEFHEPPPEMSPRPTPPAKNSPMVALPPTPFLPLPRPGSRSASPDKYGGLGISDRRFSGQGGKQLKIETFARRNSSILAPRAINAAPLIPEGDMLYDQPKVPHTAPLEPTSSSLGFSAHPDVPMATVPSMESIHSESLSTPALTQGGSQGSIDDPLGMPPSPAKVGKMMPPQAAVKNNFSSSNLRMRNLSIAATEPSNESPITPISAGFNGETKKGPPPFPSLGLPTPSTGSFGPQLLQAGGMFLFDNQVGSPVSPNSTRTQSTPAWSLPLPLEACPESFLLRPFWLMRCLYQTLAHPSGGYLTTKLFIPRDIWRVRNVKLKALEDKVSQCDHLTAALLKLAKVDTFDADAVLEELQFFETVLDQVRVTLLKKVGSDVGFGGSSNVFKPAKDDQDASSSKTNTTTSKSFASSWRKLRSKSSAPAIGGSSGQKDGAAAGAGLTMPSLPMTSSSSVRSSRSHSNRKMAPPPTPTLLPNVQPIHAAYMSSLARLFDAAQVLDGIARQVEDPGLKCSNKTQVGLELGVKNAAEFFAFYILRFVMADLTLMLDKFLKRGTEWVLT